MSFETQRSLTEDEKRELEQLNYNIAQALGARQLWLDRKMHETSKLKVGDDIYNVKTGQKLGVVSELYRYQANRNPLLDDGHYCNYEYKTHPRSFDNTSRQMGLRYGTKEDAVKHAEYKVKYLRGQ